MVPQRNRKCWKFSAPLAAYCFCSALYIFISRYPKQTILTNFDCFFSSGGWGEFSDVCFARRIFERCFVKFKMTTFVDEKFKIHDVFHSIFSFFNKLNFSKLCRT
jgi:hypothetical protein